MLALLAAAPSLALDWTPEPDYQHTFVRASLEDQPLAMAAGDFDGDGDDDLVVSLNDRAVGNFVGGVIEVFDGGPAGLPVEPTLHIVSPFEPDPTALLHDVSFGVRLATGDANADGYDDLIVHVLEWPGVASANPGALAVYLGGPSGLDPLGGALAPTLEVVGAGLVAVGDVDGDGHDDFATVRLEGNQPVMGLWRGSVDGLESGAFAAVHPPLLGYPAITAAGDVDGDGFGDLVSGIASGAGVVELYGGAADGFDPTPRQTWIGAPAQGLGSSVAVSDVTGDGVADLLVTSSQDELLVYPGTGSGFAGTASITRALPPGVAQVVAAGDHDGDGVEDALVAVENVVWFVPGVTGGALADPPWSEQRGFTFEDRAEALVVAGDFDGDGEADVAVLGESGNDIYDSAGGWLMVDADLVVWFATPPQGTTTGPTTDTGTAPTTDTATPQPTDTGDTSAGGGGAGGCTCASAGSERPSFAWVALVCLVGWRRRAVAAR